MHSKHVSRDLKIQTIQTGPGALRSFKQQQHSRRPSVASSNASSNPPSNSPPYFPGEFASVNPADFGRRSSLAHPEPHRARGISSGPNRHCRSRASSVSVPYNTLYRSHSVDSLNNAWSASEDGGDWASSSESSATSFDWPPEVINPRFLQHHPVHSGLPSYDQNVSHGHDFASGDLLDSRRGSDASLSFGLSSMGIVDYEQVAEQEEFCAQEEAKLVGIADMVKQSTTTSAADKARTLFVSRWLTANYVAAEEGNVSRQALFASYMKVCDAYSVRGLNSASFGKVIRATFPAIKTRRLGVRGNSKYHYCGMRPRTMKEASILAELSNVEVPEPVGHKPADSFSGTQDGQDADLPVPPVLNVDKPSPQAESHSPPVAVPLDLPLDFPQISPPIIQAVGLNVELVFSIWQSFSVTCSDVMRVSREGKFSEIITIIRLFFDSQAMEENRRPALEHPFMADQLFNATSLTYDAVLGMMEARTFEHFEVERFAELQSLGKDMEAVFVEATSLFSPTLASPQIELAARFGHLVQRHLGVCQMTQALNNALSVPNVSSDLLDSWNRIDFEAIKNHCALCNNCKPETMTKVFVSFQQILQTPGGLPPAALADWLDATLAMLLRPDADGITIAPRQILTRASFLISQIMRDLTLRSDKSFGPFQLVGFFCQDWLALAILRKVTLASHSVTGSIKNGQTNSSPSSDGSGQFSFPAHSSSMQTMPAYPMQFSQNSQLQSDQLDNSMLSNSTNSLSPRTKAMFQELTNTPTPQYAVFSDMLLSGEPTASLRNSMAITPMAASEWTMTRCEEAPRAPGEWPSFVPKTPLSAGFSFFGLQQSQPSPPHEDA